MLTTAISLAILTTAGCIVVYNKLPRRIRKFIEKHHLMTDLMCLVGIYAMLGGTLTALFAASICGLMISVLLHIANNPDEYMYLYDMRDFIREKLVSARRYLNAYSESYRVEKLRRLEETANV